MEIVCGTSIVPVNLFDFFTLSTNQLIWHSVLLCSALPHWCGPWKHGHESTSTMLYGVDDVDDLSTDAHDVWCVIIYSIFCFCRRRFPFWSFDGRLVCATFR